MDLFQCIPGGGQSKRQQRGIQSVDRDLRGEMRLEQQRRQSLPAQPPVQRRYRKESTRSGGGGGSGSIGNPNGTFRHWGSSVSIESENSVGDLTRRTLSPPSPTTLRRQCGGGNPNLVPTLKTSRPSLPSMTVELQSPKLEDYLQKPRLVSTLGRGDFRPSAHASNHSEFHAKRLANNERPAYRNLRLGGFMERPQATGDEVIPDMLRQYYLDTYLNVCDTCESKTHQNPTSPIQRGM